VKQLVLLLCLVPLCCAPAPRPAVSPVTEANAVTVALMVPRGDALGPLCAGVWVGDEWILTANHCVTDEDEAPIAEIKFIANPSAKVYDRPPGPVPDRAWELRRGRVRRGGRARGGR